MSAHLSTHDAQALARTLRWRYLKSSFWAFFGAIWALVGTVFLVIEASTLLSARSRAADVVRIEGVVVEKGRDEDRDGTSHHWLRYTWRDEQGGEHAGLIETSATDWEASHPGATLALDLSDADPSRAALPGDGANPPWLVLVAIGLVFGGVGWAMVLVAFRTAGRRARLIATGTATEGTVESVELATHVRINQRNPRFLRFEFKDEVGERRVGRTPFLPRALEDRWQRGDRIRVVYDPLEREQCEADIFDARGD